MASISCAYFYRRDWHSIAVGLERQLLLDNVNHTMDRPIALHSHFLVILQTSLCLYIYASIHLSIVCIHLPSFCMFVHEFYQYVYRNYLPTYPTERRGRVISGSGGPVFKSWPTDRLSLLRFSWYAYMCACLFIYVSICLYLPTYASDFLCVFLCLLVHLSSSSTPSPC